MNIVNMIKNCSS